MTKKENILGGIGWIAIIWFLIICVMAGKQTDSNAVVNVFPDSSDAKNYELTGTVTQIKTQQYLFALDTKYQIESFDWPNGGWAKFNDCFTRELNIMTVCTSTSGKTYSMKVTGFEPPESDYDPNQ